MTVRTTTRCVNLPEHEAMTYRLTVGSLAALVVAACSAQPPRAPATNAWDMSAAEHCEMAHEYADRAATLKREAALPPRQGSIPDQVWSAELRKRASRDREIAEQHAEAANRLLEQSLFDDYEPPCSITQRPANTP
jgi:hypothetical protein